MRRSRAKVLRPMPPAELLEFYPHDRFVAAPEVATWARETFVAEGAKLENPDHTHLRHASIGVLWTDGHARSQMRTIVGTAEIPTMRGKPWVKSRQEFQLHQWFGSLPDFLLTFSAQFAAQADDATFCALVEHELYHCGQALDEYGVPKFRRSDGRPVFGIRGHDAEEFVGVVRRYGPGAAAGGVAELVKAGKAKPEIAVAAIAGACGTCSLAVA